MNPTDMLPAPVLPIPPEGKWRREQHAFERLLPGLLATHRGQYVAIHEGQAVESGDKLVVARRAYARFGYVPIFVSLVTEGPIAPILMPSPRLGTGRCRSDSSTMRHLGNASGPPSARSCPPIEDAL